MSWFVQTICPGIHMVRVRPATRSAVGTWSTTSCNIGYTTLITHLDRLSLQVTLNSGRLDRKIEFPLPTEEARAHILRIHSRKMNVSSDVNFEELARCTDDFNGAQLKAVCVEAGMIALRRGATELIHEDYMEGWGRQ